MNCCTKYATTEITTPNGVKYGNPCAPLYRASRRTPESMAAGGKKNEAAILNSTESCHGKKKGAISAAKTSPLVMTVIRCIL
jgi:hypothetical protein